jgi:hypothetical protein
MNIYKCRIGGLVLSMQPTTVKYHDKKGRFCRKYFSDFPMLVEPHQPQRRKVQSAVACQKDGVWQDIEIISESEYPEGDIREKELSEKKLWEKKMAPIPNIR